MTIRVCTREQVHVLQQVARESFIETFAHANTEENMSGYLEEHFTLERLAGELDDHQVHYFLLWEGGRPAGYLKLNTGAAQTEFQEEGSLEIERIYVLGAYQGKGYGRLLLEHSYRTAQALGKTGIWLGVWERNENAIAFYRHSGFVQAGTHTFVLGDDRQTDYIMRRSLPPQQ